MGDQIYEMYAMPVQSQDVVWTLLWIRDSFHSEETWSKEWPLWQYV